MTMLEEGTPTEMLITKGFSIQWEVRRCHFDSPKKRTRKGKNIVIEETKNLSGDREFRGKDSLCKEKCLLLEKEKGEKMHPHTLGFGERKEFKYFTVYNLERVLARSKRHNGGIGFEKGRFRKAAIGDATDKICGEKNVHSRKGPTQAFVASCSP